MYDDLYHAVMQRSNLPADHLQGGSNFAAIVRQSTNL